MKRLIFDAQLDLSMNAMEWNRDIRLTLEEIRAEATGNSGLRTSRLVRVAQSNPGAKVVIANIDRQMEDDSTAFAVSRDGPHSCWYFKPAWIPICSSLGISVELAALEVAGDAVTEQVGADVLCAVGVRDAGRLRCFPDDVLDHPALHVARSSGLGTRLDDRSKVFVVL
jgi:hypothetical protein